MLENRIKSYHSLFKKFSSCNSQQEIGIVLVALEASLCSGQIAAGLEKMNILFRGNESRKESLCLFAFSSPSFEDTHTLDLALPLAFPSD